MLKRILSFCLVLCMMMGLLTVSVPASADELPFTDVPEGAWYYDAVKYVYDIGIMNGTNADGTLFSPDVTVTRAMFVAMLGRLDGAEEQITDKFPDIDNDGDSWYAGYVGWASENGIITGYGDGRFGPNDPVTREQMATIIIRYVNYLDILPKWSISAPTAFTDADKISSWALPYVEQMRQIGIVQGNSAGQFDPAGGLGRSSAATVIMRLHMMLEELALGESIRPDYTVEGENFALMSAWDLYYGGTVLDSDTGVAVKTDSGYPYVTRDSSAQKWTVSAFSYREYYNTPGEDDLSFGEEAEKNPLAKGSFFEIDLKVASIDPAEYPFIRFAYKAKGDVSFGIYSENCTANTIPFTVKEEKLSGWYYGTVDISAVKSYNGTSEQIIATIAGDSDVDILYFAAFPDKVSAEGFDMTKYEERIKTYGGEVIETKTATKSQVDAVLAEANAIADSIKNNKDDIDPATITGTCYYISNKGDDSNSGTSPDSPWRTFKNLYNVIGGGWKITSVAEPGDAVFLERGSVFNVSAYGDDVQAGYLDTAPGVTYSAYGEGEMPVITNEFIMDEPAGRWVKTQYENVWKLDYEICDHPGNISFVKKDGTELWGIFVMAGDYENVYSTTAPTKYLGLVSNGEDSFYSGGVILENPGGLKSNLEYIGDTKNGGLYVYYDKGNPGEVFKEIHISQSSAYMTGYLGGKASTIPTVVDHIAFKYNGGGGVDTTDAENYFVTNCTFEWIGGMYQTEGVRAGNAVQNWGSCDGFFVLDCYFKDIYDAAVSTQGESGVMTNFYSSGCVLDRCDLPYEFFNHGNPELNEYYPEPKLSNLFITDNYVINTGVGFCDVRHDRRGAFLYTTYGVNDTKYENVVYENNVNVFTTEYAVYSAEIALGKTEGTILRGNTYYVDTTEAYYGKLVYNMLDRTGTTKALIPYTSQYLTYLNSLGVEVGSTFYVTENPDLAGNR